MLLGVWLGMSVRGLAFACCCAPRQSLELQIGQVSVTLAQVAPCMAMAGRGWPFEAGCEGGAGLRAGPACPVLGFASYPLSFFTALA